MTRKSVPLETMPAERKACVGILRALADADLDIPQGMDAIVMAIVVMMEHNEMSPENAHHVADEISRMIKGNYHLNVEPLQ